MHKSDNSIHVLSDELVFPPVHFANRDGLLAVGGDLSPERLICAYREGIFPWFNDDQLILWWSPDPRMVMFTPKLKISKSMQKVMDSGRFRLTRNQEFQKVLGYCAAIPRKGQPGTWITSEMQKAYMAMHTRGFAISYETWEGNKLVGGLYGIDLGHVFCGESMFHTVSDASKFAFINLVEDLDKRHYPLVDCQVFNPHLKSLGAEEIPRSVFLEILKGKDQDAD